MSHPLHTVSIRYRYTETRRYVKRYGTNFDFYRNGTLTFTPRALFFGNVSQAAPAQRGLGKKRSTTPRPACNQQRCAWYGGCGCKVAHAQPAGPLGSVLSLFPYNSEEASDG